MGVETIGVEEVESEEKEEENRQYLGKSVYVCIFRGRKKEEKDLERPLTNLEHGKNGSNCLND